MCLFGAFACHLLTAARGVKALLHLLCRGIGVGHRALGEHRDFGGALGVAEQRLGVRRRPPDRSLGLSKPCGVVIHRCQARRHVFESHAGPGLLMQRTTRWTAGWVVAVIGLLVIGVIVFTGSGGQQKAKGTKVLLIGDSLLTHSKDAVQKVLVHDRWVPAIAALPGTDIEAWTTLTKTLVANSKPDVVVVELGTNDCIFKRCPNLAGAIDAMMRSIGSVDLVFWLNVQRAPAHPEFSGQVNAAINAAAGRWSNLRVVDLAKQFDPHPDWHIADMLHFNAQGQYQLGLLIAEALRPYHP